MKKNKKYYKGLGFSETHTNNILALNSDIEKKLVDIQIIKVKKNIENFEEKVSKQKKENSVVENYKKDIQRCENIQEILDAENYLINASNIILNLEIKYLTV